MAEESKTDRTKVEDSTEATEIVTAGKVSS